MNIDVDKIIAGISFFAAIFIAIFAIKSYMSEDVSTFVNTANELSNAIDEELKLPPSESEFTEEELEILKMLKDF